MPHTDDAPLLPRKSVRQKPADQRSSASSNSSGEMEPISESVSAQIILYYNNSIISLRGARKTFNLFGFTPEISKESILFVNSSSILLQSQCRNSGSRK